MTIRALQRTALSLGRRLPLRFRNAILSLGGRRNYFHPLAAVSHVFGEADLAWEPLQKGCSVLTPTLKKVAGTGRYLDLTLALLLDWQESRHYEHGTLGIEYGETEALGGVSILTFRQTFSARLETVRVRMPPEVEAATFVRVRLLPAPHCGTGRYKFARARLVDDPLRSDPRTRIAELEWLKERNRIKAAAAELLGSPDCDHLPVALTFELSAACNLSCSHCSSHGEPHLHKHNNRLPELTLDKLEELAHEVFPTLDVISVVGRGEPLVLKDEVWKRFIELVTQYRVRLSITTNGYFINRRIDAALLPLIETLNISMDGASAETFARNRGGADIDRVWRNIAYFNDLRRGAGLLRAPRLSFAWTLKQNNVAELPDFVRKIAAFDADVLTTRHLLVFFPSERSQSLLDMPPADANRHLSAAYDLLEQYDIRRDCVPLFDETVTSLSTSCDEAPGSADVDPAMGAAMIEGTGAGLADEPVAQRDAAPIAALPSEPCMFIHRMPVIMAGGEVMACAVPGAVRVGTLGDQPTFGAIWNGELLQDIRAKLNTDAEWPQCRTCSYREARVTSQQQMAATGDRYDSKQQSAFTKKSVDFANDEAS